jgi:serine/threonine protein kinase
VAVKVLKGHHDLSKCKVQLFYLRSTVPRLTFSAFHQQLLRELSVWSAVQHEHIIPFLGVTFDFDRPYTPCLVCPYYRHGDTTSYVKEQPNVNKLALVSWFTKLLDG